MLVIFSIIITTTAFSQFSRNDALDLVLNTILADDVGTIDVYATIDSKSTSIDLIDNTSIANPYAESWVFFSDDNPFASWYHGSLSIRKIQG